ncbi:MULTISPECIES: hypothetical protein [Streptomyces]|uniref:hypothetical protein n=1 Tax=Streptomyces TaxID=1883 RepID=UPI000185360A|nr:MULTISPECIES: hypothetical protein [Streptomyces]MYT03398.1 hypothetical protein [Streptomyces sp. SID5470]
MHHPETSSREPPAALLAAYEPALDAAHGGSQARDAEPRDVEPAFPATVPPYDVTFGATSAISRPLG